MKVKVIALVAFLTACGGGGGGDDSCDGTIYEGLNDGLFLGLGECRTVEPQSNASAGVAGSNSGGTSGGVSSGTANITKFVEVEPNNSLANATPLTLPIVIDSIYPGVEVTGTVSTGGDVSDYFIFTIDRSGSYLIYLCADTCTDQPTDDQVAIKVFDQFGNEISGNPIDEVSTKRLSVSFDSGLPYYVQVYGYNTGNSVYPYKLVIID